MTTPQILQPIPPGDGSGGVLPSSFVIGDILYADSTSTLKSLADVAVGSVLVSGGVGAAPAWSATSASKFGSIAIGGAAIGTYVLAVTGTSQFNNDISIASAATNGLMAFNTSDQITNYERLRFYFSGNVANVRSESGGTGTLRDFQIGTANFGFTIAASSGPTGVFRYAAGASGGGNDQTVYSGPFTASSGANNTVRISPTVAQTGSASIDALRVAPTVTSKGSGGLNLIHGLAGAAGTTEVFSITDAGNFTTIGTVTFGTAASGIVLKQGANGLCGTFVANGVTPVTVSNTNVAITDAIIISLNTVGGTVGANPPDIQTITAGVGFTVKGLTLDTSTYNYAIIKNAA